MVAKEARLKSAAFLVRQTAAYPIVGPHEHAIHFRNSLLALFAPAESSGLHVNYFVALLNSRLLRFVYMETTREAQQKAFPQVKLGALRGLPIRPLDLSKKAHQAAHDELVSLVDEALSLRRREVTEKNPIRKEALQQAFLATDAEIDRRVFALYGLAKEEVELVTPDWRSSYQRTTAGCPLGGPKPLNPSADQSARGHTAVQS